MSQDPFAAGLPHPLREFGVFEELVAPRRQRADEGVDLAGVVVDEEAGLALHHDLRDATYTRSDDRRLASHRLEVDEAERLVDGRTHEYRGTGVEMDQVFERDEAADPHQVAALDAYAIRQGSHLSADLRRVRGTRNDHELVAGIALVCGAEQRMQTCLTRHPSRDRGERRAV